MVGGGGLRGGGIHARVLPCGEKKDTKYMEKVAMACKVFDTNKGLAVKMASHDLPSVRLAT